MPRRTRTILHICEYRTFVRANLRRLDTTEITTALTVVVYIRLNEHNLSPRAPASRAAFISVPSLGTLSYVDPETRYLGEVRGAGKVEDIHVVKDLVPIEPAEDEEPAVGKEGDVVPARRRRLPSRRPRLEAQSDYGASAGEKGGPGEATYQG